MGRVKQAVHRSGVFKQNNKAHKTGRHRSKGSIGNEGQGKVAVKIVSNQIFKDIKKDARRLRSHQIRKKKREEALAKKRNLGGSFSEPILITVIPLEKYLDPQSAVSLLINAAESTYVSTSPCGITHISITRFKQRFSLLVPPVGNKLATLDAAKIATTVLFVTSAITKSNENCSGNAIDTWGEEIIVACLAQSLLSSIVALINIEKLHPKKRQDSKQQIQQLISKWFPEEKVLQLDNSVDALNILRRAGSQKQRIMTYRNKRPHLLAECVKFSCNNDNINYGTLEVTGYLRGTPLSVNGLIHVLGFGDFQMSRIDAAEDPYPLEKGPPKILPVSECNLIEGDPCLRVLECADPDKQESLQSENIPDPMDAEQTWPSEEELIHVRIQEKKIMKRVPKGTSEYQAAWIPDGDAEKLDNNLEYESADSEMSVVEAMSEVDSTQSLEQEKEEHEIITTSEVAVDEQRYDQQMDMLEEKQTMENLKEAKLDVQFPDEVDTPQDILAKIRFQKYRGLESFRTSPWDVKEHLPIDYARIFQFENFDHTRKRIFKDNVQGVMPGWYITLHIINVSKELFDVYRSMKNWPLIVFGLFPHEHKMSLLNIVLKRTSNNVTPIKSKERLIFQCGFRRFATCPIFSQHTNGNKHKYERYFQPNGTVVASMYSPIIFSPCPVLCYVEKRDGNLELIATGSVLSVNPNRIVVKRVILTGHPFKVHKRSAVVRFMFFHREDINWFKPVQVYTKYGRRGHIKEPLGTHGHMKCIFNGKLKSQDTVLMNLYKRVFPKWAYEPYLLTRLHQMNIE